MEFNRMIDHTLLKANATRAQIEKLCDEALEYNFASVCVNTCWVPLAHEKLAGSEVNTCCVVGFPLGAMLTEAKAAETRLAVEAGADEVDMVINIGWLLDGEYDAVRDDIAAVVKAADGKCVKVIIEACLLTDEQKVKACELSVEAGATFVKTSTGFSTGGATAADVALMRKTVGDRCLVKAAGGIHTADEARAMVEAGADRLGCSAGIQIMAGC
ncbi:MAG: deoxyribose-phosphate aldolase [Parolsenella sp.]|uniref:deoxyribose-phosphate aldolase n=1 Tax=Parolsenella sp. TaxID=2083006 RepID=UPI002E75ADF5|nr:deoxyribose-phosphate aldolase [Parolsenella sp.]MEE1373041.1 deoxyribose-phosphate aldolase [Parolsenella sp.]